MPQDLWQHRRIYSSEMVASVGEDNCVWGNFREGVNIRMGPQFFSYLFALVSCFLVGTGQLFVQNRKKTTQRWINQIARNGPRVLRTLSVMDIGKCEEITPQMCQILADFPLSRTYLPF